MTGGHQLQLLGDENPSRSKRREFTSACTAHIESMQPGSKFLASDIDEWAVRVGLVCESDNVTGEAIASARDRGLIIQVGSESREWERVNS